MLSFSDQWRLVFGLSLALGVGSFSHWIYVCRVEKRLRLPIYEE